MISEDIKFSILCEDHKCCDFDCGIVDLNEFLVEDALPNQSINMSITKIAHIDTKIIGYYSVLTDTLKKQNIQPDDHISEAAYSQYPAIKIGRLAVQKDMQQLGYGRYILRHAIAYSTLLSEFVGCRFITVDSKNTERALKFYTKNGFKEAKKDQKRYFTPMYLDLLKASQK